MSNAYAYSRGDLVRVWSWTPGLRCVLILSGAALELRIECAGSVMRREVFCKLSEAFAAEARWRVQYEMEVAAPESLPADERCSECADAAVLEVDSETGSTWLRCPSCGNVWLADDFRSAHAQRRQ